VAAVAKQLGCEVEVYDFADKWTYVEADLYGVYVSTPDVHTSIAILKWLKEKGAEKVSAGGPHATLMPKECLEAGFDAVCVGDGEVGFPKILKGERIAVGWLKNIDESPHPDRSCVDLKSYDFKVGDVQSTSMMTCYGCIWSKCAFCCRPPHDLLRFHSADWVIEDLKQISDLGFRGVMIYDDEFFTYPKRDRQIIKELGRMEFSWRCFGHARWILRNKQLVNEASENGLRGVLIGAESGSRQILETINKGSNPQMNREAIRLLSSKGVSVKAAMVVMLPGESPETLSETWQFCEDVEPYVDDWDFTMLAPYPGSKIFEMPEKFDLRFDKRDVYKAYKGSGTECWEPPKISTSKLSFQEGLKWRDALEQRFKFKNKMEF